LAQIVVRGQLSTPVILPMGNNNPIHKAGMDMETKRKFPAINQTLSIQPVTSHFIEQISISLAIQL
jgi:hypothetical protein